MDTEEEEESPSSTVVESGLTRKESAMADRSGEKTLEFS